jgi:hypothetical protein
VRDTSPISSLTDTVARHYSAQFGPARRVERCRRVQSEVAVYVWGPEDIDEGVWLYATAGASEQAWAGMPPSHRHEVFLGLDEDVPGADSTLAGLARYSEDFGIPLGHGHTVPAGGPVWEGTQMNTLLLLEPRTKIIDDYDSHEFHVIWLQALPLYENEREVKVREGADALMTEFERRNVPFWSASRKAAF